jgi:hypothetical protein
MEGRIVWSEEEVERAEKRGRGTGTTTTTAQSINVNPGGLPPSVHSPLLTNLAMPTSEKPKQTIKILVSVDFDAVSGWLGTGSHPDNNLADYSSGFFAGQVGVPRLLKLFKRLGIHDKVTWFVPMHSAESFPDEFQHIVDSGCEIGLHGYCHEVRASL